jgi:hypothetical protein
VHGDVARGRGDRRRRGARVRRSTALGDKRMLAFDAHEGGTPRGSATGQKVAGKSSGDELRRRRATVYHQRDVLRREGRHGHVQKNHTLTLDACVCSAWTEEVGDGGNVAAELRPWSRKTRTARSVRSFPRRFLGRGWRGRQGGEDGGLLFARGGSNRRRCATASSATCG